MQKVLGAQRQWVSDRAVETLALGFVVLIAIVMGVAAATLLGGHTAGGAVTPATGETRAYGATQQSIHGDLAGGNDDDAYVASTRGHGRLP